MTRDERCQTRQRLKDDIATKSQELAQVEAQQRADARAKRDRRRQRVGTLAEAPGCSSGTTRRSRGCSRSWPPYARPPTRWPCWKPLADTALTALTPLPLASAASPPLPRRTRQKSRRGGGGLLS